MGNTRDVNDHIWGPDPIARIYSNDFAFVFITSRGRLDAWGSTGDGGDFGYDATSNLLR